MKLEMRLAIREVKEEAKRDIKRLDGDSVTFQRKFGDLIKKETNQLDYKLSKLIDEKNAF